MRQKTVRKSLLLSSILAIAGLTGCGGGGGGGGSTTPTTPPDTSAALASLNQEIRNPQGATTSSVSANATAFGTARQQDPSDLDAQAGFAITELPVA